MSTDPPPVHTANVSHDTHGVNTPMPPISSLAAPSNIPPVMTWNSYVGLSNAAPPQPLGVSNPDGIPRPLASQVVPRNYPTSYHTSAPVYGGATLEAPLRQNIDSPAIRQTLEAPIRQTIEGQLRQTIEEPIRHTPPPTAPANNVTMIDPSTMMATTVHMTSVRSVTSVPLQQDRLAATMQSDNNIISAALESSKVQPETHVVVPTTISARTPSQIQMVPNISIQDGHQQIINAQDTMLHAPHSVAAYSVVTHAPVIDSQTGHITTHHAQLAQAVVNTPPITPQPQVLPQTRVQAQPPTKQAKSNELTDVGPKHGRRGRPSGGGKTSRKNTSPRSAAKMSPTKTRSSTAAVPTPDPLSAMSKEEQMDLAEVLKNVSMVPKPLHVSPRKLKRKAYSIKEKLNTVERVKAGEPRSKILRDMGIPDSTLRGWMKDEDKLRTFAYNVDIKKKKARTAKDTLLDSVLHSWYLQQKERGMNVTGAMLKIKADELNKDINGENNFKASAGWLYRFQKRHNLGKQRDPDEDDAKNVPTLGYKEEILHFPYDQVLKNQDVSAADEKVHQFCQKVRELLLSGGYNDEQVYTCDETGFFYKLLPDNNFLVPSDEPSCANSKRIRDRVTMLFCLNKTGQHKLKPLCVGKYRSPRGFQHVNVSKLPFWYKCSHNAWMTSAIFMDWFITCFIPEVRHYQREKKLDEKAVLLLDENPAHPSGDVLVSPDGNIQVIFLPKDTTSVVQPLDHGLMATFKSSYRTELIKEVVTTETDVKLFLRHLSLKRMMYIGEKAWSAIKPRTIEKMWHKCLPMVFDPLAGGSDPADEESTPLADASGRNKADSEKLFQERLEAAGIETSVATIKEWTGLNENLPTTDISTIGATENEEQEVPSEPMEQEPSEDEEDSQSKIPSNAEAVKAFEIGLQWLESKNIDYITILQVQSILDYARYERRNELSQLNNSC